MERIIWIYFITAISIVINLSNASAADLGKLRMQSVATTYECPNSTDTTTCFTAGGMRWAVNDGYKRITGQQFIVLFTFVSLDDQIINADTGKHDDFFQVEEVVIID